MKNYRRLAAFIRPHTRVTVLALVFMILSSVFDSFSLTTLVPLSDKVLGQNEIVFSRPLPPVLAGFIQTINAIEPSRLLLLIIVYVIVLFFLKGTFAFLRSLYVTQLSYLIMRDMRNRLYARIQHLSLVYFSSSRAGNLVSTVTYDVEVVRGAIATGLTSLVYQAGSIICLSAIVLYINWRWAFISLIMAPVLIVPVHRIGKVVKLISGQAQSKMAEVNQKLIETIAGVRVVKAFSMEEQEIQRVEQQNNDFYKIMMRMQKRLLLMGPFVEFIGLLGGVFVLYWGGREVIKGRMSLGIFILFLSALLSLVKPGRRLSEIHGLMQQALAAAERIFQVIDEPVAVQPPRDAVELPPLAREIVFERVFFQYGNAPVLSGITLTVRRGELVALVGSSGAGKTTLLSLLPRFYDPAAGRILFDGVDIRRASFVSLRRQIGIVTQDLFLFNDTVRANIAYGYPDASPQQVERAARLAEAHEFITAMPQGYDTYIGDMGTKLSGGQKQRLAIARAVLNDPSVLILDEATSQLDAESAILVQTALDHVFINRTVFVIAHRLTTIKKVNRIVVLDGGRIAEQGTHQQLLGRAGIYKRLYELEFAA